MSLLNFFLDTTSSLHILSFLKSSAILPNPSLSKNYIISSFVYFFLACPLCTYNINIDNAFENYFLKSDVIILSGNIRFVNLLTKLPWSYINCYCFCCWVYYAWGCGYYVIRSVFLGYLIMRQYIIKLICKIYI